jgi:hypothetical protein
MSNLQVVGFILIRCAGDAVGALPDMAPLATAVASAAVDAALQHNPATSLLPPRSTPPSAPIVS